MKRITLSLLIIFAMFTVIGCPPAGTSYPPPDNNGNDSSTKRFWAINMTTDNFYQLNAQKLAENSDKCEVWVEKTNGATVVDTETANNMADAYNTVYTKMMNTFGYQINSPVLGYNLGTVNTMQIAHWFATGTTSNAKLTILLLDIKDDYEVYGDPYVAGYFYTYDLFENDPSYPQYKSNELDMIYVDTYPAVPGSQDSNETLAHEMQHLMNFISSVVFRYNGNTLNLTDTWVDEGLSSAAEWVYTEQHPDVRWAYYNEDPSGLIAKNGNSFFIWDNHGSESPLANLDDYSTVYLFFQYLRLQSSNPSDIYFDIETSTYSDYQAVTNAASINSAHKNNWSSLLRDWYAANYLNNASGLYGYKNDDTLKTIKAKLFPTTDTNVDLYPGEGVYSKTTTADTLPTDSTYIKYAGLSTSGAPSSSGTANGARLTYNVNTNKNGSSESGSTTGIAASVEISMPDGRSVIQQNKFSYPFKVDMGYFTRRNGKDSMSNDEIRNLFNTRNGRSVNKDKKTVNFDISTLERVKINE